MLEVRIRHINALWARNLHLSPEKSLLDVKWFFTLKSVSKDSFGAFYRSSMVTQCTMNPMWDDIDLSNCNQVVLAARSVVVGVYYVYRNQVFQLLEWEVKLNGLKFYGEQFPTCRITKSKLRTMLIFQLGQHYYSSEPRETAVMHCNPRLFFSDTLTAIASSTSLSSISDSRTKQAYTFRSLMRLQMGLNALAQYKERCAIHERAFIANDQLCENAEERCQRQRMLAQLARRRVILQLLAEQVRRQSESNALALKELQVKREKCAKQRCALQCCFEELQSCKEKIHAGDELLRVTHKDLVDRASVLYSRRTQLISELCHIYPIVKLVRPNAITASNKSSESLTTDYSIAGVCMPATHRLSEINDMAAGAALGYTASLLLLLASLFDLPLRYPMYFLGSRSRIHDPLHSQLEDKLRNFPLYTRGQEHIHFMYGCYLVNKNVQQLRLACGLTTSDLRETLHNINDLIVRRLNSSATATRSSSRNSSAIPSSEPSFEKPPLELQNFPTENGEKEEKFIGLNSGSTSPSLSVNVFSLSPVSSEFSLT